MVQSQRLAASADAPTVFASGTQMPDPTTIRSQHTMTTGFDSATLKAIAADLTAHLGPVAGIVVKSAAKKSIHLDQLVRSLAEDIADGVARADFIRKHAPAGSSPAAGDRARPSNRSEALPTGLYPPASTFEPALLAKAEAELAQHIGAVAKAIVRRAATTAHSEHELYELLTNEIEDASDKKAFLRKAMSISGRV